MSPFYPLLTKPADPGTDLTLVKGGTARAQGQLIYLIGQVFDIKGKPIGRYRFKTIKPGPYPVTQGWDR